MASRLSAAAFLLLPVVTAQSAWPQFGHDAQHSRRSPHVGAQAPTVKWMFPTGSSMWSSPSLGPDGTSYVGSDDQSAYAVSAAGKKIWELPTGRTIYATPAVSADGLSVFIASTDYTLYCVDAMTGAQRWNYTTGVYIQSSPTLAADGSIYISSEDKSLYKINGTTGKLAWSYATGDSVYSSAAVSADGATVYVGSDDNKVGAALRQTMQICNGATTPERGADD